MYHCGNNIFTANEYYPLADNYKLHKTITPGVSGSRVYLIKQKGRQYFCKITALRNNLTKVANLQASHFQVYPEYRDILIGCQLTGTCFPKIYQWGRINYLDPWNQIKSGEYIFIVSEYLGKTNLKQLLINKKSRYTLKDFRKNILTVLDCYIKANKKVGFVHDDFKPDNIMIDKKRPILIDFGLSYTTKYKKCPNLRVLATRLSFSLLPLTKIAYLDFDKLFTNKSLYYTPIHHEYIDLEKIIRTINLGERILGGTEIKFSDEDYKYFNSKVSFHRKLNLIKNKYATH